MTGHRSTRTAPLPTTVGDVLPRDLAMVSHDVGYTEVCLSNGDRLRLHLFVDKFRYCADDNTFIPEYRVVSELQPRNLDAVQITGMLQECWRC